MQNSFDIQSEMGDPSAQVVSEVLPEMIEPEVTSESEGDGGPTEGQHHAEQRSGEDTSEQISAMRQELLGLRTLLNIKTHELRDAQSNHTAVDATSLADVRRMVERLNAESFQLSASLADRFAFLETHHMSKAAIKLRKKIPPRLVGLLQAVRHDTDPHCVQMILQSCISSFAAECSERWFSDPNDPRNQLLTTLYEKIRITQSSSSSRRWRALTYRALREGDGPGDEASGDKASLISDISETLAEVILTARVNGNYKDVVREVAEASKERLLEIVQLIEPLRKAIFEDVTSCTLRITFPVSDTPYDGSHMEASEDAEEAVKERHRVLYTTDLGLKRELAPNGVVDREAALLKSKVVLENMVNDHFQIGHNPRDKGSSSQGRPSRGRRYGGHPRRERGEPGRPGRHAQDREAS